MKKSRGIPLASLPPHLQRQAMEQLGRTPVKIVAQEGVLVATANAPIERRLRQSQKPIMNKLETLFHEKLLVDYADLAIYCQGIRLELSRGHWYKPDFFLPMSGHALGHSIAYEVKGPKAFRGGFENLKDAARVHKWCKFYLVWQDKELRWQRQEILS